MKKDVGDLSQRQAANEAGFSERQTKQAVIIANIPENEFENAIEGDEGISISISKLA